MACGHCAVEHPVGTSCPAVPSLEGQRHGPLVLREAVGWGSVGTVYRAEHGPSGHLFAVKVLHPRLAVRPLVRAAFLEEARRLRGLRHRHVARVLDARPGPQGLPCMLMEYVEGEDLARLPVPLPPGEVVGLLTQVLEALEAAHARGLVHGGLSTECLRLTRGERRVKVLGFETRAVLTARLTPRERACGMVVGSPEFLAPEQWMGLAVDARTDVYALGVVGYLLVTGRLPFGFGRVGGMSPVRPEVVDSSVPRGLSAALLRALAEEPEERFENAREFREALLEGMGRATARTRTLRGGVSIFGDALPEDGATPMHAALREVAHNEEGSRTSAAVAEVPAFRGDTGGGLASDVALGGVRAVGLAPRMDARREVTDAAWGSARPEATAPRMDARGEVTDAAWVSARPEGTAPRMDARGEVTDAAWGSARLEATAPRMDARGEVTDAAWVSARSEATAPRMEAPTGLCVRLGLAPDAEFVPVRVGDVTVKGFFAAWAGPLPPLAAQVPVELMLGKRQVVGDCDVVRHVTSEEARGWGGASGLYVQFAGESARDLLAHALGVGVVHGVLDAEPVPDAEVALLLVRSAGLEKDPYALLGALPHEDFEQVRRRALSTLRHLSQFRQRPLPVGQRQALEDLLRRVDAAGRALGEPSSRVGLDAARGNLAGVARCLDAGLSEESTGALRQVFLSTRPLAETRARALFDQGHALEAAQSLAGALARYAEALVLDPLNVPWLRHYRALRKKLRLTPTPAVDVREVAVSTA
ncbi:serine/threonine protein kinase [Myxococcus stipitatus DSM 14675]|uniref:Serine/threonine protein kinase n=1 Tax=Myxococcus stipitatus (strain DSM 14675 / JCM 12634 / Mx s8) TaxID=1278073 RepID=L7UPE3_MYXSD|nr:serine/threonine-protein kinase [Myxococcus stipitatus]AGC48394.1 serine/threonine protein kinase [Myxococcus stipitatus DSM 14675]